MRLTTRFLLLRAVVFVALGVLVWLSFEAVVDRINMQWGREFAQRQVLFDKYRTLSPLIREIELARKMAAEPVLVEMALNEHEPLARKRGLKLLEEYRYRFASTVISRRSRTAATTTTTMPPTAMAASNCATRLIRKVSTTSGSMPH